MRLPTPCPKLVRDVRVVNADARQHRALMGDKMRTFIHA